MTEQVVFVGGPWDGLVMPLFPGDRLEVGISLPSRRCDEGPDRYYLDLSDPGRYVYQFCDPVKS